jgi:formate dehydrogenase subunit delta
MNDPQLVRMANQIAQFFEALPDQLEAAGEVAQHLRRFWTPAMRARLSEYVANNGEGVRPLVRLAVGRLHDPA